MGSIEDILNNLMEMGFSENQCKLALCETDYKGLEAAMEWLLAHADDDPQESENIPDIPPPKAPLTEEEKAEKLRELEELRVKKRAEREEREKAEELEREKRRVTEGKALNELRKDLQDREMKKIAEERRREKLETLKAKERVKAQIEADKRARKEADEARRGLAASADQPSHPTTQTSTATTTATTPKCSKEYSETRLQIRLPDGSVLRNSFQAKEPLSAVRLFVQMNRKDGETASPKLMTHFPKKIFGDEDYDSPLEALDLVPSASIIVMK